MPVTKTAKRALRNSRRKEKINSLNRRRLEIAFKLANKTKTKEKILRAISSVDRAAKGGIVHPNKAARLKGKLAKLLPKKTQARKNRKKTAK